MMKKKWLFLILFFSVVGILVSRNNPWGNLKRIHFYDSQQNYPMVLATLERIDPEGIERSEMKKVAQNMIAFGDYYYNKGEYDTAEAFYRKVLTLSSEYWYLYNRLEKIDREKGSFFINFKYVFKQFLMMIKNFDASFTLVGSGLNLIFYTGLFVFFLYTVILFIKYFKLAANDLLVNEGGILQKKKLIIVALIIFWPLLMLSGWMIYPFILAGFLWNYFEENERKTIFYLLVVVFICTIAYSLSATLEKSASDPKFKTIQKVYAGHLFEPSEYEKFDNSLKVAQAVFYYDNKKYDTALDLLSATGDGYRDKLKFDLLGNIYFRSGDLVECRKYYSESLKLDDRNETALNNFTLGIIKENDEEVFTNYAKRYPEMMEYKKNLTSLKEVKISTSSHLWRRILSFSEEKFEIGMFLQRVLGEFLRMPVLYFIFIFIIYLLVGKKVLPLLGDSTYCSKCSRIVKEVAVHKSYKLCDDCYQLFLIKDVIFLEAKILKEKELSMKYKKKYLRTILASLIIPGVSLNGKDKNTIFIFVSMLFYFLIGLAVMGSVVFNRVFSAAPLMFSLIGMLALLVYFLINIFSVLGDYDGF